MAPFSQELEPPRFPGRFTVRKKLEDYVLVTFALSDIPTALAALQADPYVAEASEALPYRFSSVELTHFSITPSPEPLADGDQYGFFDMNVDAAWRLAGGHALVGQIDMGLYENHPALRQWSGSSYVGGNFIKTASRDVGLTGEAAQAGFDPLNVDEKKTMWIDPGSCTASGAMLPPAALGHGTVPRLTVDLIGLLVARPRDAHAAAVAVATARLRAQAMRSVCCALRLMLWHWITSAPFDVSNHHVALKGASRKVEPDSTSFKKVHPDPGFPDLCAYRLTGSSALLGILPEKSELDSVGWGFGRRCYKAGPDPSPPLRTSEIQDSRLNPVLLSTGLRRMGQTGP